MAKKLRVHSLTGRITPELMARAFKNVKRNHGSKGLDGVSIEMFNANMEQNLAKLMRELKDRSYQPSPLKRVYIPKDLSKNPKLRPLGIPAVRCRCAQEVVRMLLNPIFDQTFHPMSFGFRPGRNCHQAISQVKKYLDDGYKWVVDADIKGFFDNIPHDVIMEKVSAEVADGNILNLIRKFLRSGVMEEGVLKPTIKGTPQGGVISPLLANITLNELDWALEDQGYKFVRYADDFVILCRSKDEADKALLFVKHIIEDKLRLELSKEKTKIAHLSDSFNFLGFTFKHRSLKMCDKAVEKFKDRIRNATIRCHNLDKKAIERLNRIIRGTTNYFVLPYATVRDQLHRLDKWIRMRIRCMKYKEINKLNNTKMKDKTIHSKMGLLSCFRLYLAAKSGVSYSPT